MEKSFGKFMIIWSGELVSAVGTGISAFGIGIFVYKLTGRASATSLAALLAFLPALLLSVPAGVLADRFDRRLIMILGDGLSALGLLFIYACLNLGHIRLWQIYLGLGISSVFASLIEPAYKATVSDLLSEENYARASGLVQAAGSAKFLISPVIAGFLLTRTDLRLLLLIDMATFFLTILTTMTVRKGLPVKERPHQAGMREEIKEGWAALSAQRGIMVLLFLGSAITFFLGFIQTLSTPMVIVFSDSASLGLIETIAASGMLVSSLAIGIFPLKRNYAPILAFSLFLTGLFMVLFGLRENLFLIGLGGFLFFATLPFANTCLDFLLRTNIENSLQGRAWGIIGLISQFGYVLSFALAGPLADYLFTPLLLPEGPLAPSIGRILGTGPGRGTGLLIVISGLLLSLTALVLSRMKSINALEGDKEMKHAS